MRRSWDYSPNSGGDYYDHLSKMIRTPSILPDVPQYPNVHQAFNRSKPPSHEKCHGVSADETKQPKLPKSHSHGKSNGKSSLQFQEKVEVIEFKEEPKTMKEKKGEVVGDSVDSKADGYIQQRHQKFELCKWATFKVH